MTTLMVVFFATVFFTGFFALVGTMLIFLWSVDLFLRLLSRKHPIRIPVLPTQRPRLSPHSI